MNRIEEYFKTDAYSQSQLKAKGGSEPRINSKKKDAEVMYYEEKRHFVKGSLVDTILTAPELLDSLYHIIEDVTLSEKQVSIIKYIWDKCEDKSTDLSELPDLIIEAYEFHKYQARQLRDTKIKKCTEECSDYWNQLREAGERQIIPKSYYEVAKVAANSLMSGEYTKQYFQTTGAEEIKFQLAVYFEYMGKNCKALMDMVRFDHVKRTIQLIDIKTTGDYLSKFSISVKKFRYDIQLAFYNLALKTKFPEYTILQPILLAVSFKEPEFAEPFEISSEDLLIGSEGSKYKTVETSDLNTAHYYFKRDNSIDGYEQLLERVIRREKQEEFYNEELMFSGVNKLKLW